MTFLLSAQNAGRGGPPAGGAAPAPPATTLTIPGFPGGVQPLQNPARRTARPERSRRQSFTRTNPRRRRRHAGEGLSRQDRRAGDAESSPRHWRRGARGAEAARESRKGSGAKSARSATSPLAMLKAKIHRSPVRLVAERRRPSPAASRGHETQKTGGRNIPVRSSKNWRLCHSPQSESFFRLGWRCE